MGLINSAGETGQIICTYDVYEEGQYTKILGDEFIPESRIVMTIDGEEMDLSNKYLFPKPGRYEVTFELEDSLNMDFMFKGVLALTRVEMTSKDFLKLTKINILNEGLYYALFDNIVNGIN